MERIGQVRGFADRRLRTKNDPFDPENRRISVLVQYTDAGPPPAPVKPAR
jgi:chemotaxis protein MotB